MASVGLGYANPIYTLIPTPPVFNTFYAMQVTPKSNRTILSVAELNAEVNQLLVHGFPLLWVEGEISNLVRPSSGHLYFSLKDNKAQIRCAMFRNRNMKLSIKPENGMKVLLRGRVGLYEPRGDYQLIAEHMEDAGVGLLQRQFEALKQKLSSVGLFAEEHKQELPEYPKIIGIITSPTGAAIRDILHVLKRRSPQTPVLIYPVAVQGELAKIQIESALRQANAEQQCDVLILARGGGSIEDLWAFNEENVAKAIYQSEIPVICGVGHEIDFTIADFVADVRAPTPSAAAELVTEDVEQLLSNVIQNTLWLQQKISQEIKQKSLKLDWLQSRLNMQAPSSRIKQQFQKLDECELRLNDLMRQQFKNKQHQLDNLITRLKAQNPVQKIKEYGSIIVSQRSRLEQAMKITLEQKSLHLDVQMAMLDSVSPLKTLDRGFAVIRNKKTNKLISRSDELTSGLPIKIQLQDGERGALVD